MPPRSRVRSVLSASLRSSCRLLGGVYRRAIGHNDGVAGFGPHAHALLQQSVEEVPQRRQRREQSLAGLPVYGQAIGAGEAMGAGGPDVVTQERDLAETVAGAKPPYRSLPLPRDALAHLDFAILDDVEPVAVVAFPKDGLPRLEV